MNLCSEENYKTNFGLLPQNFNSKIRRLPPLKLRQMAGTCRGCRQRVRFCIWRCNRVSVDATNQTASITQSQPFLPLTIDPKAKAFLDRCQSGEWRTSVYFDIALMPRWLTDWLTDSLAGYPPPSTTHWNTHWTPLWHPLTHCVYFYTIYIFIA